MKYLRAYPFWMQVLQFFLMVFVMISLCLALFLFFIPKLYGMQFTDMMNLTSDSPIGQIRGSIVVQGISSMATFLIPSLLFAYLSHPRPFSYVGMRQPSQPFHVVLAILLILGAMPLLVQLQAWVGMINFGPSVKSAQQHNVDMMKAYLTMPTLPDFIRTFTVMAIIPAIGEELFFRGVSMRFVYKRSNSMLLAIIFSSAIFAFVHSNIYGLASILIAGGLLATIYYLTNSLWCSIAAHMCFNGMNVVLAYVAGNNTAVKNFVEMDSMPVWIILAGAAVFGGSLFALVKTKTPLPKSWGDDFEGEQVPEF